MPSKFPDVIRIVHVLRALAVVGTVASGLTTAAAQNGTAPWPVAATIWALTVLFLWLCVISDVLEP